MRDIMHTNEPVLLSFVCALLRDAGIKHHVADANMSIMEGSIGVFPRRVLVADEDFDSAAGLLRDAGLQTHIRSK